MKENIKKSISALSIIIFAFIVYKEVFAPTARSQNGSLQGIDLTLAESVKIYEKFGGQKGELPITIFVTSWCSVCRVLESALSSAGVKFAKADLEKSRDAYLYYQRAVKGQTSGVPVTIVGKDVFVGYDAGNIARSIKALRAKSKEIAEAT
jgi:glutaredoxin